MKGKIKENGKDEISRGFMAILKSEIRNKYSQIPNSIIRAKDVTDAEYRLLIYLYSLPDGWKINQGYLGTELNCSRININKKIKKLKEAGYLEIIKASKNNSSDYIYILKEKDVSLRDVSVNDVSLRDVSLSDTYINTNIINTDNINTNINSISSSYERIENEIGRTISSTEYEQFDLWLKEFGEDMLLYAIKQALFAGVTTIRYINGILNNWKNSGYKTKEDVLKHEIKIKNDKNKPTEELFDYNWLEED